MIRYLGIVKNGVGLLSTIKFAPKIDDRDDPEAWREAARALSSWQTVFPFDNLSIVCLSSRTETGREVCRRRGVR